MASSIATLTRAPGGRPRPAELAIVTALTIVVTGGTANASGPEPTSPTWAILMAGGAAALLITRRWVPELPIVTALTAVTVYELHNLPGGPIYLLPPAAIVALATVRGRRPTYLWAIATVIAIAIVGYLSDGDLGAHQLLVAGWSVAAAFGTDAWRSRSERTAARRERIAAERRRAATDERLRIAQDLHDSVAHAMVTINVQSGVAAHLIKRHPDQAEDALEAIRVASADVLDELTAILGVLREDEQTLRHPTPDLSGLFALVDQARANGLDVELHVSGNLAEVGAPIGTAAYRVLQEALTNVIKHAPAAHAIVDVERAADGALRVAVVDDGDGTTTGDARAGAGLGLIGMRERVHASGGTVSAGPAPQQGFSVRASWEAS